MLGVTATFNGYITTGYLQYLDLGNSGHTLVAVPGGTYTIAIASGWEALAAIPSDGFWQAASPSSGVTLTSVPAAAEPGALYPGSPGPAGAMSMLEERSEDELWAEGVVAAAGTDPVYGENRERLAGAREQLAVLRRQQGRKPG